MTKTYDAQQHLCSVIIPVYNCESYVGNAIQSVLNQTYSDLEIILIDDCSSDDSYNIVQNLAAKENRIHVFINEKNIGVAKTRNRGFLLAAGEYVALLDSDDIWQPNKLELQISLLNKTAADFCYTAYSYLDEQGNTIGSPKTVSSSCTLKQLLKENYILPSTVILRKEAVEKHKMSAEYFHEDFVFWLELLQNGYKACGCTQSLVKYRVSKHGRSYNKLNAAKNRWLIYRNYLNLPFFPSIYYFCAYTVNGLKKYRRLK